MNVHVYIFVSNLSLLCLGHVFWVSYTFLCLFGQLYFIPIILALWCLQVLVIYSGYLTTVKWVGETFEFRGCPLWFDSFALLDGALYTMNIYNLLGVLHALTVLTFTGYGLLFVNIGYSSTTNMYKLSITLTLHYSPYTDM